MTRAAFLGILISATTIPTYAVCQSNVIWDSSKILSKDSPLPEELPSDQDAVVFPSHAGEGGGHRIENGMLQWYGNRARIYFDFYKVKELTNSEIEFYAEKNAAVGDVSVKIGNHSLNNWVFGGYTCDFYKDQVKSKAEYYHNEQGKRIVAGKFPEALNPDVMIGYKVQKQNIAGTGNVVMNCFVDFSGTGEHWVKVMDNRIWTNDEWAPPGVPSGGEDSALVESGVYNSTLHRWWIRINGKKSAAIKIRKIVIRELGEATMKN
jgi:hypothetical protein